MSDMQSTPVDNIPAAASERPTPKQPPMFSNITSISQTLAEAGYNSDFNIVFEGDNIASGCRVAIKDKRGVVIGRAHTVVPGRPVVDVNTKSVFLEVFFANLQIYDGPVTDISISITK